MSSETAAYKSMLESDNTYVHDESVSVSVQEQEQAEHVSSEEYDCGWPVQGWSQSTENNNSDSDVDD